MVAAWSPVLHVPLSKTLGRTSFEGSKQRSPPSNQFGRKGVDPFLKGGLFNTFRKFDLPVFFKANLVFLQPCLN